MLIQKRRGRLRTQRRNGSFSKIDIPDITLNPLLVPPCELLAPVGLPDVYRLWVRDAVLPCLVVQQVKKVFDGQWNRTTGAEDDCEEVVHKLL